MAPTDGPEAAPRRSWVAAALPWVALVPVFAILARWSWRKWPDLLVDFGHQLYVPWRLVAGEVLYRDLAYIMGPASQYFNALAFALFGVSLTTLIWVNLAILAAIAAMLVWLVREVTDSATATLCGLVFLCVFSFSQYVGVANFNYVCPYRHEMTHGVAAILALLVLVVRWQRTGRIRIWGGIGVALGTTAMLKVEIAVVALAALGAVALLAWARGARKARVWAAAGLWAGGGLLVPVCGSILLLARDLPPGAAVRAVFTNWSLALSPGLVLDNPFYVALAGFDAPGVHIGQLLISALSWVLVVGALVGLDRLVGARWPGVAIAALGIVACASALWWLPREAWFAAARPLPLIALGAAVVSFALAVRSRAEPLGTALAGWFLWSVVAFAFLVKMLLNCRFSHYGFVLAMPATLLAVALLTERLPGLLRRAGQSGRAARSVALGLVAAFVLTCLGASNAFYERKTLRVGPPGDEIYHAPQDGARQAVLPELIETLERTLPRDGTLLVLPEGISINYLLRLRNPLRFYLLTPWEMEYEGGEEEVLQKLRATPPDTIVLLSIDMREYGSGYFGTRGYGERVVQWIEGAYALEQTITRGDPRTSRGFQAVIFRRP